MKIKFNDQIIILKHVATLADLLKNHFNLVGSYAVMLNKSFIPKSNYINVILNDNDHVEIIRPMQGG